MFVAAITTKPDILQGQVTSLVESVLGDGPCFVVSVAVRGSTGSHAVDVFVESDGVLDARTLSRISRDLGFLLDTGNIMPGSYTLNVSSPGADRPLRMPRQYRKVVGRKLRVHYRQSNNQFTEVVGKLERADEQGIRVEGRSAPLTIPYGRIVWAKVQLPW